jgi:hypothetical protein
LFYFNLVRDDGFAVDQFDGCLMATVANGLPGWAKAIGAFGSKTIFYDPVFQGVEGDNREPAAEF